MCVNFTSGSLALFALAEESRYSFAFMNILAGFRQVFKILICYNKLFVLHGFDDKYV